VAETTIQWADYTFNPWVGCQRVSPGCEHCYAESYDKRVGGAVDPATGTKALRWGPKAPRIRTSEANWLKPLKWNRDALAAGERHRVFCSSLADVFEDRPELVEWRAQMLDLVVRTPSLDWLLLTKRPEHIARLLRGAVSFLEQNRGGHCDAAIMLRLWLDGVGTEDGRPRPPTNVWLGTTVEDQRRANERIPELLQVPAAVRFLSCEPQLESVDLDPLTCPVCGGHEVSGMEPIPDEPGWCTQPWCEKCDEEMGSPGWQDGLSWVIIGGESGPGARPFDVGWARNLVRQCRSAGIAPFVKQLGACASDPENGLAGAALKVHPDAAALISHRLKDRAGGDMAEWPEDLRVREFPSRVEALP
jgi:protein gp37